MAKYHLGKVKLKRVGQRSSPTSVCDLRGGPRGIAELLVSPFAIVACIVALLADRSGSIFCLLANHCGFLLIEADQCLPACESLRILAPSPPSLPSGLVSIFSGKYLH